MALLSVFLVGLVAGASGEACAEGASEEQSLLSLPPKMPAGQLQSSSFEEANATGASFQRSRSMQHMIKYDNSWSNPLINNFCLSVINNELKEGSYLQLWECVESSGQMFSDLESYGKHLFQVGGPNGHTFGFPNGKYNGAKAKLTRSQKYFWDNGGDPRPGEMKPVDRPEMCLVVDDNNAYNGAKVQLWKCHEGSEAQQKWSMQKGPPCAHAGEDVYDENIFKGHTPVKCCDGQPAANYNAKMLCPGRMVEAWDKQIWCDGGRSPRDIGDAGKYCKRYTCDEKHYLECCMKAALPKDGECWGAHGCRYHCA